MKWLFHRKNSIVMASMALFHFLFLGIEFLFDDCLAGIGVGSAEVVTAQNLVLGISVLGYLLYPVLSDFLFPALGKRIAEVVQFLVPVVCFLLVLGSVYVIQIGTTYAVIFWAGAVCFLVLGYFGNGVCFLATQVITDFRYLARVAGFSYALGVLLQYIHTNLMSTKLSKLLMLVVGCLGFVGLLLWQKTRTEGNLEVLCREQRETFELHKPAVGGFLLIACVLLMTCLFSTLDNAVTLVHSSGEFNIGQWPRLILAVSGLFAGFLYDICNRKYMTQMMYLISILAVIAIVILAFDGSFLIGLIMFYVSAGFFVVFFTSGFMDMSVHCRHPKLWAGLGRGINNLCALVTSATSVALLASDSTVIMIVALVLLGLLSVVLLGYERQLHWNEAKEDKDTVLTPQERDVSLFAKEYALTEREEELLRIFLQSEDAVQDVAAQMAISRAALYRHIQALNEKTGTKTRVGIVQCFYQWSRKK